MTKKLAVSGLLLILLVAGGWLAYSTTSPTRPSSPAGQPSASTVLDFRHRQLTSLPASVNGQTGATQLLLSYNQLTSLPSQLGHLQQVQVLLVDHNQLRGSLPAEIRQLPLVTLDASYNQLTGIPAEIGQLQQLQTLDFSHNQISTLPNEIANLKQLKTLNLTGNPLTSQQIARLKAELPATNVVF